MNRLDAYQRRHRWLGLPIAVVYKFIDDQGGYLAALITYYGFLSLFPLLLIFSTVLGYLLPNNPALQQQLAGLRPVPEGVHPLVTSASGAPVGGI